jgi:RNA polymerase sigma-70 factor (ECF subfamily)
VIDDVAIREFLASTYPRVVAAIAMTAGSRDVAEDAVQEALARAWERSARGLEIGSLPAWVTTVALNLSRSRYRRMRIESRAIDVLSRAEPERAGDPDDRVVIAQALRSLPRRQREVTVLRYYLGLDVAEIADALGVSDGTVKTSLHRARAAMAARLGEAADEEVDADDAPAR